MTKSLESICVDYASLDEIYPFHLVLEDSNGIIISHCGPALAKRSTQPANGQLLSEHFEFQRPSVVDPDYESILKMKGKLVCLSAIYSNVVLRGQLVPIENGRILYLSSLHITSSHTIADMNISIAELPAHDFVPDVLMLQRIKEMQLDELARQNKELSLVIKERDQFDEFANTDSMTQLLNRRGFQQQAIDYLDSQNGIVGSALLLIDVDNFKSINDMFGHSAGDAVLQEIGARLKINFGESSVIGRWGGDEFVALISCDKAYGSNTEESYDCINRIRGKMMFKDKTIDISLSCGIVDTRTSNDIEQLIHYADLSMYQGRRKGSGNTYICRGEIESEIMRREETSKLIAPAIWQKEFVPYFQPILDISSSELVGFEALARWPSPQLGMVMPLDFIEAAESKGMLKEFDHMMLSLVIDQLSQWHKRFPDIKIHINLSAPSFTEDLPTRLINLMLQANVPRQCLVVELTETSLFVSSDDIGKVISDLVDAGFSVELDDFGTGYSSLNHLKDFPVTGLKVDMSFVRDAESNPHTRKLLAGIVHLSNILDLHCVAEGIETEAQLAMLAELNCDSAQGYLFSKPVPADDCTAMLEQSYFNNTVRKAA